MTLENCLSSERYRKLYHYSQYDKLWSAKDKHVFMFLKNMSLFLWYYQGAAPNLWLEDKATVPWEVNAWIAFYKIFPQLLEGDLGET